MTTAMNAAEFICPQNVTAHDGTVLCHWSNSPGTRGTLNIFWLCISTLGLCVWNAVHPDVPRPRTPGWRVLGMRICWLFAGLFMPEMLVLVALAQLRQACDLLVEIDRRTGAPTQFPWWMYLLKSWRPKRRNSEYDSTWWMRALLRCLRVPSTPLTEGTHAPVPSSSLEARRTRMTQLPDLTAGPSFGHVGDMPSPRATDCDEDVPIRIPRESSNSSQHALYSSDPVVYGPPALGCERVHRWTLTHSFYAVMYGFVDDMGDAIDIDDVWERIALPFGDPERIPDVSVDDIEDRCKAGPLAKSLLIWQLFVFLANCFARWVQFLPLSLLEITTIGHSLCSIVAMTLWWYKPHTIREAIAPNAQAPLPSVQKVVWRRVFRVLLNLLRHGAVKAFAAGDSDMDVPRTVTITMIAVLYGLPHLLGLFIHFPTYGEQICWKVATFTVIGSPLVMCVVLWILPLILKLELGCIHEWVAISLFLLLVLSLILYPVACMFLVGESVRQIFALPVESFREPQLTSYLPRFS